MARRMRLGVGALAAVLILLASHAWGAEVKTFIGGAAISEEIGGSLDTTDRFELTLTPFKDYALLLVGFGRGDLDAKVTTSTGEVLAVGDSIFDVEVLTFRPPDSKVYLEVRVADGYDSSSEYVIVILGPIANVRQLT